MILAFLLLCGAGLFAIVESKHGGRVAEMRKHGLVTEGVITAKREERRAASQRKNGGYLATVIDVSYDSTPDTAWEKYIAQGEKLDPPQGPVSEITRTINTGSRAEYDSMNVGDRIALVVDPRKPDAPERAEFVRDFAVGRNGLYAGLLALAGFGAILMWWRARKRAAV